MSDKSGFQIGEQAPRYYESHVERFMAPFVESLVLAAVSHGDAVLDVACGTGFATRAASVAVGPIGRVVGSDLNPGMVAMAQSVPYRGGCDISWRQASALKLPFDNAEFNAVVCQQGIQFFPDVSAGLREMARVVKKGGRLAVTVWASREQSPYLDAVFGMLSEHCSGDSDANAKVFANDGESQVRGWFDSASLGPVSIELVEAMVSLPPIAEYVPDHIKALPPPSFGNFFDLSDKVQSELLRSLGDQLGDHRTDSGFDVPFRSYLATTVVQGD
jgi:SAM-dependent methyltransferase